MIKEMVYEHRHDGIILASDYYKGYCYVVVNYGDHPCAYIGIPKEHEFYEKGYDEVPINAHGGLTYSGDLSHVIPPALSPFDWWIGWDYAHYEDYTYYLPEFEEKFDFLLKGKKWTTVEIIAECNEVIDAIVEYDKQEEK